MLRGLLKYYATKMMGFRVNLKHNDSASLCRGERDCSSLGQLMP